MKKKKGQTALAAVLIFVFVVLCAKNFADGAKKKRPAQAAVPAVGQPAAAESMSDQLVFVTNLRVNDKVLEEQLKTREGEWTRDPFVPQAASAIVRAVNLTLNGILWDDSSPKAIVNEKTVIVGDTLYGYTVVAIKPRSVVLRTGEKSIELHVFRPLAAES